MSEMFRRRTKPWESGSGFRVLDQVHMKFARTAAAYTALENNDYILRQSPNKPILLGICHGERPETAQHDGR